MTVGIDGRAMVRRLPALLALGLVLALAACGGGDRVSTFRPQKLVVFGDETSVIVGPTTTDAQGNAVTAATGSKYTVNAYDTTAMQLVCSSNPIWIQVLAANYGFGFAECNPYGGTPRGTIYAKFGAHVADLANQVAAYNATSAFANTDLVTVMVGQRDILDAYQTASSAADCNYVSGDNGASGPVAQAVRALGVATANQVNGIAQAGGRVLIATVPNQGATPYAGTENLTRSFASTCLTSLTNAFNGGLRTALINDGRLIGLVQADEQVQLALAFPSVYGYANISTAACTDPSPLQPTCTTSTLASGATAANFLWADNYHLNAGIHGTIGNLAVTRAVNNPF